VEKIANITGPCSYLDENVTIRARFSDYSVLGNGAYATPIENLCKYRDECDIDPDDDCPVFNQTFRWNEL